eukprot:TRINITY_DN514_c0_g1_i7.p1 TRINITY_DN514_c0_g1~~TRINITY_DN514_c0_g1_i7.p1  ORF type:complete len:1469 (-),score=218.59 TRINITY_DN514_c0_g1_i7:1022-5428(-)
MRVSQPALLVAVFILAAAAPLADAFVTIQSSQTAPLLDLKEGFGPKIPIFAEWGLTKNCAYWLGVTCNSEGYVIALEIPDNNLDGNFSESVGKLKNLTIINLSGNSLSGDIPTSIGNLTKLYHLDLSNNGFGGTLPILSACTNLTILSVMQNSLATADLASLGTLSKLQVLDLTNNALSGKIPTSFPGLTSITYLSLSSNYYTGDLPTVFFSLSTLVTLDLSYNSFTGDLSKVSFAALPKLTSLSLAGNNVFGSVPDTIGAMTNLQSLDLSNADLNGTISASLSSLTNLQYLTLAFNGLQGTIPSLSALPNLISVDMSGNELTGSVPSLAAAKNLDYLDLGGNQLGGTIPTGVWALPLCTYLSLSDNELTGGIPSSMGSLSGLQTLDLSSNFLVGPIPNELFGAFGYPGMNLTSLILNYNELTGGVPTAIGSQKYLSDLLLNDNHLDGSIPAAVGSLTMVTTFDVHNNAMVGTIPSTIKSMTNLGSLQLYNNKFSGVFLDEFKTLSSIVDLQIQNNSFSGVIPPTITSVDTLSNLNMSNNKFSGSLPPQIFNMTGLNNLDLHANLLSGSLPSAVTNVSALALNFVDLHSNALTGSIPESFWGLTHLYTLDLSSNKLTGPLSSNVGNLYLLQYLFLQNNKLGDCSSTGKTCTTLPNRLGDCESLFTLSLANNAFTGAIPASLDTLTVLDTLDLSGNRFTGGFTSTQGLLYLDLSNNYLSSPIKIVDAAGQPCPQTGIYTSFYNLNGNCFGSSDVLPNCTVTTPRASSDCDTFCNAGRSGGACGGRGTCVLSSGVAKCLCYTHYTNKVDPFDCVFAVPSTGLSAPATVKRAPNQLFRYASSGFLNSTQGKPVWSVATSWNWVPEAVISPVSDQKTCAACWAFAAGSALESAEYIATAQDGKINTLSVQELLDCVPSGGCGGGFPADALAFTTSQKLVESWRNPYQARVVKDSFCAPKGFVHGVKSISYETVAFFGHYGLLLAVQQQPVIVNIESQQSIFTKYKGGILADPVGVANGALGACYYAGLDHTVLLVGYDLLNDPPFWIIKNSWGSAWGEVGYARLTIKGGFGTCGMNVLPGLIPVVKGNDACNTKNYGLSVQGNTFPFAPGTMNPCGGGLCDIVKKGGNKCFNCPPSFLPAVNTDGSTTCAPENPCLFYATNPCGVGECVNIPKKPGVFTCLCPFGYQTVTRASDSTPTCVVGAPITSGFSSYKVPSTVQLSCANISDVFHIKTAVLEAQNSNPAICVDKYLAPGTRVNITGAKSCALPYFTSQGDTCVSIIRQFNLSPDTKLLDISILNGDNAPNPNLICQDENKNTVKLDPGTLVCIKTGDPLPIPACSAPYVVKGGETCASLVTRKEFNFNYTLFFALNPGLNCDRLSASLASDGATSSSSGATIQVDSPFTICLASANFGAGGNRCGKGSKYSLGANNQHCLTIYKNLFDNSAQKYLNYNDNVHCSLPDLYVGKDICVP